MDTQADSMAGPPNQFGIPSRAEPQEPVEPLGLTLYVTPQGAFAAGALVVSALALAFALGRRLPVAPTPKPAAQATAQTIEEVRQQPPILYHQLQVDTGAAE